MTKILLRSSVKPTTAQEVLLLTSAPAVAAQTSPMSIWCLSLRPTTDNNAPGFRFFLHLPINIRPRIWNHTLPRTQVLRVFYNPIPSSERIRLSEKGYDDPGADWALTKSKCPTTLRGCQESRSLAKRAWYAMAYLTDDETKRTWFNFRQSNIMSDHKVPDGPDYVRETPYCFFALATRCYDKMRHLAIAETFWVVCISNLTPPSFHSYVNS